MTSNHRAINFLDSGVAAVDFDCDLRHFNAWQKSGKKDARYFLKHLDRTHRLRRPYKGELAFTKQPMKLPKTASDPTDHPGYYAHMLIVQIEPGFRERRLVYLVPGAPNDELLAQSILLAGKESPNEHGAFMLQAVENATVQISSANKHLN